MSEENKEGQPRSARKKRWGDRHDAWRVRDLDPIHVVMPYLMPKRCDAEVFINEKVDVTNLLEYVREKNIQNPENKMTLFHVVVAAMAKTITMRPFLNRFIAGRRIYERHHVSMSFIVKRQFQDHAEESIMTLIPKSQDNLTTISKAIVGDVHTVRKKGSNDMDDVIGSVAKLPRPLLKLFLLILNILEYYGKNPRIISDGDGNHTTVLLSNLGSIKCGAPYHHLNNYGTNSIMGTLGVVHKEPVVDSAGNLVIRDMLELGLTLDERIADGFYFAKSVRLLKHLLSNPELLELPLEEKIDYEC